MKRLVLFSICLFLLAVVTVLPSSAAEEQAVVVGRVSHIEGDLLRYVPAERDWVAVVADAPFGTEDTFFSGNQGMAELIAPNGTWIRLGYSTQIQFINLAPDLSEADVAAGVARFYNKAPNGVIKVTCPFGYVLANPDTVFDFYVGENSMELIAIKGTVSFVHNTTQARYDATAGYSSILADQNQVSSGEGAVDPAWDEWNGTREGFWAQKSRVRGRSAEYLPPSLQDDAYALEENGRWETVVYEGTPRRFWRPTVVAAGWAPFTVGRWTDWGGDQTWVPAEPFGYMTHHYGNWVLVGNIWYWAPPVVVVRPGVPLLNVGYFWTPGRVSWIHSGSHVGWVPLAPAEPYYSHRHWGGRHNVVVTNINITRINVNVRNYAYANHAVIVNQNNFYNVTNYRTVQVTNINRTTIINNYRAAPVVNNTVIHNYNTNRARYNFTNVVVKDKPHNSVVTRIQQNEKVIRTGHRENAAVIEQQIKRMPEGRINRAARIDQPKATNVIVPANQVNRPKSEIKLPQREVKPAVQPARPGKPEGTTPGRPGQPVTTTAPAKPGQQGQPGIAIPSKPGQTVQPGITTPSKPAQPGQQGQPGQPGVTLPAKPGQPAQPGVTPPTKPGQPVQPGITPPSKPGQLGRPGPPEVTLPAKPGQPTQPGITPPARPGQPGITAPSKPGQMGQPGQIGRPETGAPPKPTQPAPRPQPQVAPQPAPQPAPRPQPQVAPQPAPRPQVAPQPAPRPQPQVAQQPAPRPQPQVAPQPAPQPAPRPQVAQQPAPRPQPQPAPQPTPRPQVAPQPAPKPQAAPQPSPRPQAAPKPSVSVQPGQP